ncbi:cAMP-binding domain of CRP or a regulatory subunit of cAMP-dependent protein kinases [Mesorhizobium sp. NFR06]|jgi:CRP-like cAMP-binding protein|uniref:Crp/Fnr family transcriptional regulator n=1 Tax=Mesorhizobium sp. NFR06 TaxID=1566290 RepID=UPI0008F301EF|nr:Crp/Fnr family transcriptional regulator [Mesorhizobium sp. NFR06]SFP86914.1 cAMP-binding domain of CRP or a regulatory subunit of cAMP-dependent protein kinases [Mesorhizobium sp. NFR06]
MDHPIVRNKNGLLRRMSDVDFALLVPNLRLRSLDIRQQLETAGQPIGSVYFFESGIASVVARNHPGLDTEVGVIGSEGMSATALLMGADWSTHDCYVQMIGAALCIDAEPFRAALDRSETLRLLLLRYVYYLQSQTRSTALSNARGKLEDRMARWLLMCDDRSVSDVINVTHEFLSVMLGVRRPGVTICLQILEGRGLIWSKRGEITLRDREGLIRLADGYYGQAEADYLRLLGV